MQAFFLLFAILFSISFSSLQSRAETVEEYLQAFHANPAKVMQRLPSEVDKHGVATPRGYINDSKVEKRFSERKAVRAKIMGHSPIGAIIGGGDPNNKDYPERLVEPGTTAIRNMNEMESRHLSHSAVPVIPWPDSYWPMYKGLIAYRYADRSSPKSKAWIENRNYSLANPAAAIVASGDASRIDTLSPAEKYDFAVGDSSYSLTKFSWRTGQKHYDQSGHVASWMGICHGWSAAAHMQSAIPAEPVRVIAANGTPVTFYPQDVKALQSMLWANASVPTRFVGNRCDTPRPPKNAYGRILDPNCFDVNPATWHIALVNQLGVNQRSFVMDSTYDAQVWNYALANYKYRYFNPQNFRETNVLSDAVIPIERYTLDKFKEFRAPDTRYIAGIAMDIVHVGAINPTRAAGVEAPLKSLRFIYDLELDANYNIIGGEWYSNAHPDFIWTFDKGAQARAADDAEIAIDAWNLSIPVPAAWSSLAQRSSERGVPLFSFISRIATPAPAVQPPRVALAPAAAGSRR